jgi:D-alanyl-D-alanine carboxypeptidase/D-alanyl-D-alanine-endopeptidase (penicillin-binding protein 4)
MAPARPFCDKQRMRFLEVGVVAWSGLVCAAPVRAHVRAQGWAPAIEQAEKLGVRTGVAVLEAGGEVQALHRADEAFAPASNMKLCTAAAVLTALGAAFEFTTRFELADGRLAVHAGGDPNWIDGTPYAAERLFVALVAALQRLQVTAVRGVDLDAGTFTGPSRPPTWPQDQLDTYYCAPTGPFVLEQGTFRLRVQPGAGSVDATVIAPAVAVPIEGHIDAADAKKGAVYGAVDTGSAVRVSGKVWQKAAASEVRIAMRDPVGWFQRALEQALRRSGIAIDGAAPVRNGPVLEWRTPLQPALLRMLEDSSNFDAEQCLRVLGAQQGDGSLQGGVAAGTAQIAHLLGKLPDGFAMLDGSGLSRDNRVTPRALVRLLGAVLRGEQKAALLADLPVAAESGTLEKRFAHSPVKGRVHAKTGWIRGVSALSGVLERGDGSRCLFSILMNYDPAKGGLNPQLKALQEQIVEALDRPPVGH